MIKKVDIQKIKESDLFTTEDLLAVEEPLEISMKTASGTSTVSVTMRTPGNDEELAAGFLFTEGIIFSAKNLGKPASLSDSGNRITIILHPDFDPGLEKLKRNFYTTSSCGVCGKDSIDAIKQVCRTPEIRKEITVKMAEIFTFPEKLRQAQQTFEATGGIHASAFFDINGNLLALREDVGRHNALDKLIGAALLQSDEEPFFVQEKIVLLSGRASFELIQKAAMAGVQIVCAIGAPSSLAVETAEDFGMTLIGFLKNGKANVYCGAHRIKF